MRFRKFTKRLAPYLTAYLLLVTIGLPLNRVYCACVGEAWLTVLPEEHQCSHHSGAAAVDHHHVDHACTAVEDSKQVACAEHGCGNSEQLFQQLDADFLADWELLPVHLSDLCYARSLRLSEMPVRPVIDRAAPIRGPAPPPLPYGRDLLAAQQTFLI